LEFQRAQLHELIAVNSITFPKSLDSPNRYSQLAQALLETRILSLYQMDQNFFPPGRPAPQNCRYPVQSLSPEKRTLVNYARETDGGHFPICILREFQTV
jgi:hypothetical protein